MMGMDKMLQAMIGLSPEEMKQKAAEFETFVKTLSQGVVSMNEKLDKISTRLEAIENGPGK